MADVNWYHRSCRHSAAKIDATGVLVPTPQPVLGDLHLIWFTPLVSASAVALGMAGRHLVTCDRMEALYVVLPEDRDKIVRWGDLKRDPRFEPFLTGARRLDAARGAKPGLWAVAAQPVRVERVL